MTAFLLLDDPPAPARTLEFRTWQRETPRLAKRAVVWLTDVR